MLPSGQPDRKTGGRGTQSTIKLAKEGTGKMLNTTFDYSALALCFEKSTNLKIFFLTFVFEK